MFLSAGFNGISSRLVPGAQSIIPLLTRGYLQGTAD